MISVAIWPPLSPNDPALVEPSSNVMNRTEPAVKSALEVICGTKAAAGVRTGRSVRNPSTSSVAPVCACAS